MANDHLAIAQRVPVIKHGRAVPRTLNERCAGRAHQGLIGCDAPMPGPQTRALAKTRVVPSGAARKAGSAAKRISWPVPMDSRVTAAELARRSAASGHTRATMARSEE